MICFAFTQVLKGRDVFTLWHGKQFNDLKRTFHLLIEAQFVQASHEAQSNPILAQQRKQLAMTASQFITALQTLKHLYYWLKKDPANDLLEQGLYAYQAVLYQSEKPVINQRLNSIVRWIKDDPHLHRQIALHGQQYSICLLLSMSIVMRAAQDKEKFSLSALCFLTLVGSLSCLWGAQGIWNNLNMHQNQMLAQIDAFILALNRPLENQVDAHFCARPV